MAQEAPMATRDQQVNAKTLGPSACRSGNHMDEEFQRVVPTNRLTVEGMPEGVELSPSLREQGLQRLRAGELAQAIDLLSQARAHYPDDPQTQLGLGIALQGMRRHVEALQVLERAQKSSLKGALPFLHASLSLLALGKAEAALEAASEACKRAPQLAQAHSALGQALLALDQPARAEQAFAAALRLHPQWADVWVLCGAARHRRGAIEGAREAMREALRLAPGHAGGKANLAALERTGGGERTIASAAPQGRIPAAIDRKGMADNVVLSAWRPTDPRSALGLAVEFLSRKPAFARLQFGEWSQVLYFQVARGHFFFVVDQSQKVRGFLGWALTSRDLAEQWVEGRAGLRSDQCCEGDCAIINAWAADTAAVNHFIVETGRKMLVGKRALYFKRHYPNGRTRPMRLSVNRFVGDRLARSAGQHEQDSGVRCQDDKGIEFK
jgi:tetratricopeptide (TPR) repeat protein